MNRCQKIGSLAQYVMLCEVAATPKPGLVDRANSGAHSDMDFFTFLASTAALGNSFAAFASIGENTADLSPKETFRELQREGVAAERLMFSATEGVNTHKGAIFSLGLVCGAVGRLRDGTASPQRICALIAEFCGGICEEAFARLDCKESLTKGERIYLREGLLGVRGEAERGYRSVLDLSLPLYSGLIYDGVPLNNALVQTLLHLIAHVDDTNILARHDRATADYVKSSALQTLSLGGMLSKEGKRAVIEMDADFIRNNISPGGSADLLAVTQMLYEIAREEGCQHE